MRSLSGRFCFLPGCRRLLLGIVAAVCFVGPLVSGAGAYVAPRPVWRVSALADPTSFTTADASRCETTYEDCDQYSVMVMNVGDRASNGPIRIKLSMTPAGPNGVIVNSINSSGLAREAEVVTEDGPAGCDATVGGSNEALCETSVLVRPGGVIGMRVRVLLGSGLSAGMATGVFTVEGGGGEAVEGSVAAPINASVSGGIDAFHFEALGREGQDEVQAGDHPARVLSEVDLASTLEKDPLQTKGEPLMAVEEPKMVAVETPVGFLGDPEVTPKCPPSELVQGVFGSRCPADTQIGGFAFVAFGHLEINKGGYGLFPIYNLRPETGYPAEFGFNYNDHPVVLYASVVWREGAYRLRVTAPSVPRLSRTVWLMTEFFGEPGVWQSGPSPAQELAEDQEAEENGEQVVPHRSEAFLTNPVDCEQPSTGARAEVASWVDPEHPSESTADAGEQFNECNLLQFAPGLEVGAESTQADEPTGYQVKLNMAEPLNQAPVQATPELKRVTVQMPPGTTLSPSAAYGLSGCQPTGPEGIDIPDGHGVGEYVGEDGMTHLEAGHCPNSSKIGTAQIKTPLLPEPLSGSVYLREPECGVGGAPACTEADAQDGKLLGLYIEVANPASGVVLKLAGTASVDTQTGQVTTTFAQNPQFPASEVAIKLNGGPDAPLTNPVACGAATATSEIEPWSAPITPTATPSSSFDVDWDGAGGACPGTLPFNPSLSAAGTTSPMAGGFSPFALTVNREDREQSIGSLAVQLPAGLLAMVSKVPLCPEPQASQGACGPQSLIGSTTVAVGAGSHPYYVKGSVYLTGPYGGGPFGLSVTVPAVAGPFNLGTVTVRAAILIDSRTARVTTVTSPLPQTIDGVPLQLRVLGVTLDRPEFVLNPTDCAPQAVAATLSSTQGATASLSRPFTAAGCKGLPFKPGFSASTVGKASKADGASLDVRVSSKGGPQSGEEANIAAVEVELPKQLPSRLATLRKACTAAQFEADPAGCPKESDVGTATAATPILAHALQGPAYLVSHGGAAFPDLEIVLQGEGVTLVLDGNTEIKNGITSSTFKTVPDAPISSFELKLPAGPYSVLGVNVPASANYSLCRQTLSMPTAITGQNGAEIHQNTPVEPEGCPAALTIVAHKIKGRKLTIAAIAPAAGTVTAGGKGLTSAAKTAKRREAITLKLAQKRAGKLKTTVNLTYTPNTGKDRKKQTKTLHLRFKK